MDAGCSCSCQDLKKMIEEVIDAKLTKKKRRKPSEYNNFISKCMTGDGKSMKDCSVEWKEKKR